MVSTERLKIHPLSDDEMQAMIDEERDEGLKQAYSEMLSGSKENPDKRVWYAVWAMRLKDSDMVIGNLSFKGLDDNGTVEIGYGISPEYEGRGYMTEAVTAMAKWAVTQPGVLRVEAETDPDNAASRKVLLKSGFLPNGIMGEEGPRFSR